jgi:hypothetical protein
MDDTFTPSADKSKQSSKKAVLRISAAIAASLLFFTLVSPTAVPLVMLIVGFIMLGILLYGVLKLIIVASGLQTRLRPIQRRAIVLLGVCFPLIIIMLQSIGQLTIRDTLTLGGLFMVGAFYIFWLGRGTRS